MKTLAIGAAVMMLSSSGPLAQIPQQGKEVTYACMAEWSAGGRYDGRQWAGVQFNPDTKFMLRLVFLRRVVEFDYYAVTISETGYKSAYPCIANRENMNPTKPDSVDVPTRTFLNSITCNVPLLNYIEYRFNIETLRFLKTNHRGYIDGNDARDSTTPYVTGGTCTNVE
jgi:hypothetical protein